jgi:hypothetical protein
VAYILQYIPSGRVETTINNTAELYTNEDWLRSQQWRGNFSASYKYETQLNLRQTGMQLYDFCCNSGSPDGRDEQPETREHVVFGGALTSAGFLTEVATSTRWRWVRFLVRACRVAGWVSDAPKRHYLAMGAKPEVHQQVGGLGFRMTSSCKIFQSQKSKQDNVLGAARTKIGL